jgi:phosphoribosyl 1,2-cyclic phosphate phosphodiesterase
MRVILLGTGTSHGVPVLGCHCKTCSSSDERDIRTRSSALVKTNGLNILIDTATEFRLQSIKNHIDRVDLVLLTHCHADHICGFDDLRRFNELQREVIGVYGEKASLDCVKRMFAYIFNDAVQLGGGKPQVELNPVCEPFAFAEIKITPIPVWHGRLNVYGYRIGNFAYVTDCSHIPETSMDLLKGLDLLILGVLRFREHPTHLNLNQGLEIIKRLKPQQTLLTHICHDFKHAESKQWLPDGVALGYDGQRIEVREP